MSSEPPTTPEEGHPPSPPSHLDRLAAVVAVASRLTGVRLSLWLVVSAWFLWPLIRDPYRLGTMHDAAYFLHHAEAAFRSWHDWAQLPVWNPWFCGGIPGLGNLQESSVSPTVILHLLLGLMPGIALSLVLWFALGMEGAWRYAHRWGATRTSALVAALGFALSGRFVNLFADGQPAFIGFQLTPWVLLGFELGMSRPWAAVGGGVAMSLIFLEGGAVATPMLGVLLLWLLPLHILGRLLPWPWQASRWQSAWRPLQSLVIMGLVAVGLSALKLMPAVESLMRWPREWHADVALDLKSLWEMLVVRSDEGGYAGPGTAYVGLAVVLSGIWAVVRRPSRGAALLVFLILSLGLAMGDQRPWAPWALTAKLPILKNLRCSFRMTFFTALFAATAASVAVGAAQRDLRDGLGRLLARPDPQQAPQQGDEFSVSGWRRVVPWALAALLALVATSALAWQTTRLNHQRMVQLTWEDAPRWVEQPFAQALGNRWEAQMWPASGLGSIGCFEEQPFPTSRSLRGDLPAEEYLSDPEAGSVQRLFWSPHQIDLKVQLVRATILKINQNFHRGWRTNVGRTVDVDGLLGIALEPGDWDLQVRHRDPLVWTGVGISAATALGLLALAIRAWRRRSDASTS